MLKRENSKTVLRYLIIFLLIFAAALLQNTTGLLPEIRGARVFLLIPVTVCVCMFCKEITGAVTGILAGVIWDIFSGMPDGSMALFLGLTGFLCAFFIRRYMINSMRVCMIFCIISGFAFAAICAVYYSRGFSFEGIGLIFTSFYFPSFLYTLAVSPIVYLIVRKALGRQIVV